MKGVTACVIAFLASALPFRAFAQAEDCKKTDALAVEVVRARFGVLVSQDDQVMLLPVSKFPAIPGTNYGWYVFYKTQKTTVTWREEVRAPAPIQDWGKGERSGVFTVSSDRKTAVTERTVSSEFPLIQQVWDIGPGDPTGVYVITVYIDGVEVAKYEINLVPVPDEFKTQKEKKQEPNA